MLKMKASNKILTIILVNGAIGYAAAGSISSLIWEKSAVPICGIYIALLSMAGGLAVLMIAYGGVKWVTGADDPGVRKQAKDLVMHAIIAVIIILVASGLVYYITQDTDLKGCGVW